MAMTEMLPLTEPISVDQFAEGDIQTSTTETTYPSTPLPFKPKTVVVIVKASNNSCAMMYANRDNGIVKETYKVADTTGDFITIDLPSGATSFSLTDSGFSLKMANAVWAQQAHYIAIG